MTFLRTLFKTRGRRRKEADVCLPSPPLERSLFSGGPSKKCSFLSLTPCFSGVFDLARSYLTVLTVSHRPTSRKPAPEFGRLVSQLSDFKFQISNSFVNVGIRNLFPQLSFRLIAALVPFIVFPSLA